MHGLLKRLAHPPDMDGTVGCVALLLFVALHVQGVTATKAPRVSLSQDLLTSNGTKAVYATLNGVPHWRLLPHLWVDKTVRLRWTHGKVVSPMSHADACPLCSAWSPLTNAR